MGIEVGKFNQVAIDLAMKLSEQVKYKSMKIDKLEQVVVQHLLKHFTIAEVSRLTGLSRSTIGNKQKKYFKEVLRD